MTITLFMVGSLIFLKAMLHSSLEYLKGKVDVNAYFNVDAPEDGILAVKSMLESKAEVASVEYVSREMALERFRERHKDDQIELQALEELGDNPLRASLAIKAKDPTYYESIKSLLETDPTTISTDGQPIVAKVNYNDNKTAIERLTEVITGIETFGLVVSLVLVASSIVIVFNTIRMAIYISREEIAVMRLVGATDTYIRGPFVFEGMMYGIISSIITLVVFYPLTLWLGPATQQFFGNINVFTYYTSHFGQIFLVVMAIGVFLGALSSFLAVKKYLRV
jgi:cell division transport system permease protein